MKKKWVWLGLAALSFAAWRVFAAKGPFYVCHRESENVWRSAQFKDAAQAESYAESLRAQGITDVRVMTQPCRRIDV